MVGLLPMSKIEGRKNVPNIRAIKSVALWKEMKI